MPWCVTISPRRGYAEFSRVPKNLCSKFPPADLPCVGTDCEHNEPFHKATICTYLSVAQRGVFAREAVEGKIVCLLLIKIGNQLFKCALKRRGPWVGGFQVSKVEIILSGCCQKLYVHECLRYNLINMIQNLTCAAFINRVRWQWTGILTLENG